jgi:ribosomal protein L37E
MPAKTRYECRHCGSSDTTEIKREPVLIGKLTDHKITIRCSKCGKDSVIGDLKG